ncbi:chromate transporter [Candidatus Enterococcus willemsii]|uniref:Chromate transporter n=1 Tax=Candidatus Enterococcus willemsii TaxID=1857215 RepID=A0ABQ6Z1V1_9ENTE|nr:chromate transporter [Enterococcus sp. CU12B]KAF1305369.1 hypothetical protein BAU17_13470 [Enterococcus sp. CU12B]
MLQLFTMFLKIGFLGFGGGYAMLALIYQEATILGMTVAEFADLNALDALIPGPIAINSATYIGQYYVGFLGGLVATLTVSMPSIIIVPLFMKYEQTIRKNPMMNHALTWIKLASVGLLFGISVTMTLAIVFNMATIFDWQHFEIDWLSCIILLSSLFIHLRFKVNPIILTGIAGILGYISYYLF